MAKGGSQRHGISHTGPEALIIRRRSRNHREGTGGHRGTREHMPGCPGQDVAVGGLAQEDRGGELPVGLQLAAGILNEAQDEGVAERGFNADQGGPRQQGWYSVQ